MTETKDEAEDDRKQSDIAQFLTALLMVRSQIEDIMVFCDIQPDSTEFHPERLMSLKFTPETREKLIAVIRELWKVLPQPKGHKHIHYKNACTAIAMQMDMIRKMLERMAMSEKGDELLKKVKKTKGEHE